tara:strand:+ start:1509 stop:2945 length:1437 start_codon:yes stop_codon:yes gene_type:complete
MTLGTSFIGGVKWTSLSMVSVTVFHLLTLVVLARLLSPEDFGLMAILMIVVGFAQAFMDMGISNAIIQRQDVTPSQLSSLYWLNVMAGVILSITVFLLAPFIAGFYERLEMAPMVRLLSLVFVVISLGHQYRILCQKDLQFRRLALIEMSAAFCAFIVAVYSALQGFGVYALIYGMMTQAIVNSALFLITGLRYHQRPTLQYKHSELKGFFSFGLYQMGEKSINYLSANADNILIGKFLGMEALGFYNLAWQLCIFPVQKITPVINKVAFPVYAQLQNQRNALGHYYAQSMHAVLLICVPLLVFLFYFCSDIVAIMYGDGWEKTATLASILVFAGLTKISINPGASLVLALGRADVGFWWNLVWLIIFSASIIITLSIWPEIDVIALLLAGLSLLFAIIWHVIVIHLTKLPYKAVLVSTFKINALVFVLGGIAFCFSNLAGFDIPLARVSLGGALCLILYLPYLFYFERNLVKFFQEN